MKALLVNGPLILAALIVTAAAPEIVPRHVSQTMLAISILLLVVGAPVAALYWFGRYKRRAERAAEATNTGLWFSALAEAETELVPAQAMPPADLATRVGRLNSYSWLPAILSLLMLAGCSHAPAADWPDIEKGMMATDVIAMIGAPQHVQSNGNMEAWKYCRDFYGFFADRNIVIWMDRGHVSSIQYHRNLSDGSCEDFFRTVQ